MTFSSHYWKWMVCVFAAVAFVATPLTGRTEDRPQEIVDAAIATLEHFSADPDMEGFRSRIRDAKGVLIVPALLKAGFIMGGSGGNGVLLARVSDSGKWSYPAFYTMASGTFGLQAGVEKAEVVLLVMTGKGMKAILGGKLQLGADASVAAGPVGAGVQAATADVLQYSRSKGVFGGLTVEGAVIAARDKWNHAYYGAEVTPKDILVSNSIQVVGADKLRKVVATASR